MLVVFDLSGVVFTNGIKQAVVAIAKELGVEVSKIEKLLGGAFSHPYRKGEISSKEFWKRVGNEITIGSTDKIRSIFFNAYELDTDVIKIINRLRDQNTRVAYASNGPEDRTEYLEAKYSFKQYFDFGMLSYEVGCCKPDEEFFNQFIDGFDVNPKDTLFIDDRKPNIDMAIQMNMQAILFTDSKNLQEELVSKGLLQF